MARSIPMAHVTAFALPNVVVHRQIKMEGAKSGNDSSSMAIKVGAGKKLLSKLI